LLKLRFFSGHVPLQSGLDGFAAFFQRPFDVGGNKFRPHFFVSNFGLHKLLSGRLFVASFFKPTALNFG
jgi:hypothetical protein